MSVFFSRFMGYESQCGTNKSHENRFAVHAICLFRTAIHIPWTEKKRHSFLNYSNTRNAWNWLSQELHFSRNALRSRPLKSLFWQCCMGKVVHFALKVAARYPPLECPLQFYSYTLRILHAHYYMLGKSLEYGSTCCTCKDCSEHLIPIYSNGIIHFY